MKGSRGIVFLVSGPAGIGKTTICNGLLAEFAPDLQRGITATTRPTREGERNGVDYHFLTVEEFERKVASGDFCEHALVHGHHYGTLKSEVGRRLDEGIDLLLNVDVQGADAFRDAAQTDGVLAGQLHTVFLMPIDLDELRNRLYERGTDSEDEVKRRLIAAQAEMGHSGEYDHCVTSGSREEDLARVRKLYLGAKAG